MPGERHTGLIVKDWPLLVAAGETTRYVGDALALVVAETEDESVSRMTITVGEQDRPVHAGDDTPKVSAALQKRQSSGRGSTSSSSFP